MGNQEIEGSYTLLPPAGFFTREKAAFAIATELIPDDKGRRAAVAEQFAAKIYDALCAGQLIGRDLELRLPIERRDLAGVMMLSGCIISESDLNDWLVARGVGVALGCNASEETSDMHDTNEMAPGTERDSAMLETHARYEKDGKGKYLVRTAAAFNCSKTVVTRAIARARTRQSSSRELRSNWDPFDRR